MDVSFRRSTRSALPIRRAILPQSNGGKRAALPTGAVHNRLELLKQWSIFRVAIAECGDHERYAVLPRRFQRGNPDGVHKLPKPRRSEIEHVFGEIDGGMVFQSASW